jgi:tRNA (guanine-N7-)-methyltransferase
MRMRKKKNGDKRLSLCSEFLLNTDNLPMDNPAEALGMADGEVYLEIGAGKGGFACEMARRNPNAVYFAMERVSDCVVLAAEKASAMREAGRDNLRFIIDTADNLTRIFAEGVVDRIFLNFSDPWSKKGYAKRRLTHRRYLAVYFNLLRDGGKITFKTDNVGLFDFTLEEISAMGITPDFVTRDLHSSERNEGNVMTEYEKNFSEQGMKINMVEITKPIGYKPEIPENLSKDRRTYGR